MAAANTYTQIASTTLGSAAASVTLSSIPATYTDLVLVYNAIGTAAGDAQIYFNGDNSSGLYSRTVIEGNGTSAVSARIGSQNGIYINYNTIINTTSPSTFIVNVQNYANTTTFKTILNRSGNASYATSATVGLWRNTAAINSVTIVINGTTFAAGTTANLYGITAA